MHIRVKLGTPAINFFFFVFRTLSQNLSQELTIAHNLMTRLALNVAKRPLLAVVFNGTGSETYAANPTPHASFSYSGSYRPCFSGRAFAQP